MFYGTIFCKATISISRDGVAATASKEKEKRKFSVINYRFQREMHDWRSNLRYKMTAMHETRQ